MGRPFAVDAANFESIAAECGWKAAVRRMAIDYVELAAKMNYDMLYVPANPAPPKKNRGGASAFPDPVSKDPVEDVLRRVERAQEAGIPQHEDGFLIYTMLREEMDARDLDLPLGVPAATHGVWKDTALMLTMLVAPEVARRHFANATRTSRALIDAYIAIGIDVIGIGGDIAVTRAQVKVLGKNPASHGFEAPIDCLTVNEVPRGSEEMAVRDLPASGASQRTQDPLPVDGSARNASIPPPS